MQEDFANGVILWTSGTGAHALWGEFFSKWRDNDTGGNWQAGFPTSDIHDSTTGTGQLAIFQNAVIVSHPTRGTHIVYGDTFIKYQAEGLESGWLGFPISDVTPHAHNFPTTTNFEGGWIYSTPGDTYTLVHMLQYDVNALTFPDVGLHGVSVSGNEHLSVFPDGTWRLRIHLHNGSALYSFRVSVGMVIAAPAPGEGHIFTDEEILVDNYVDLDIGGRDYGLYTDYRYLQSAVGLSRWVTTTDGAGSLYDGNNGFDTICRNWGTTCRPVFQRLSVGP